ncbi:MAG: PilX N-terminal domain-containing pilus assembly protein [Pseudomonas sp.]|uniref:pilus assembly PilX family protein n=1 Tax=Pseudomonas abieticivorans TaxID=2931382 RepID=UPI0020BD5D51|nr:PilX N-terminal domain-containing pilus assembly protein [Pseudomonas sp. PIA16]MDE1168125.1 PilX N-terminal domain-containing pilus assembly protein [Pseudomonas sp.]
MNVRMGSIQLPGPAHQRGMVLLISLVMLLLLTMIGISSMQNATLQEKMTSSVQRRNESFQLAEAALRVGENAVAVVGYTLAQCTSVVTCQPPAEATSATAIVAGTNASSGVTWVAAGTGFYGVQFIGTSNNPVNASTSNATASLYRVTAVGTSGTSKSVLESIYAKW